MYLNVIRLKSGHKIRIRTAAAYGAEGFNDRWYYIRDIKSGTLHGFNGAEVESVTSYYEELKT